MFVLGSEKFTHTDSPTAKIEDAATSHSIPKKVDTIVSEPIGVLLVHERMIESFIEARDKFLKPGGSMFPSSGW